MSTPITLVFAPTAAEAAAAGIDSAGPMTVVVRPSELGMEARAALALVADRYEPISSRTVISARNVAVTAPRVPLVADTSQAHAWLDALAETIAEQRAGQDAREAREIEAARGTWTAWLEKSVPDGYRGLWGVIDLTPPYVGPYAAQIADALPELKEAVAVRMGELAGIAQSERETAERATAAANTARREADAQAAQRRAAQLVEWLATQGTEGMRKRAARGLLPESDLIAAIRDHAFAPLGDLPRLSRLTDAEVRDALNAYDGQAVDYTTREATSASDSTITQIEWIEDHLPGAQVELREHVGYLEDRAGDEDPEIVRRGLHVTLQVGELTLTREYSAD